MRRYLWFVVAIVIIGSANLCFAVTPERIKELQDEGKKLIETRQQYTQAVQQIDMRLLELQGILKEDAQEKEKVKPEVKNGK